MIAIKLVGFYLCSVSEFDEMVQRVDWSPRKRCKIVLLNEQGYSYEEIRRHIDGNLTKGGISKFLKRYKETRSLQNQTGKGRKGAQQ